MSATSYPLPPLRVKLRWQSNLVAGHSLTGRPAAAASVADPDPLKPPGDRIEYAIGARAFESEQVDGRGFEYERFRLPRRAGPIALATRSLVFPRCHAVDTHDVESVHAVQIREDRRWPSGEPDHDGQALA